MQGLKPTVPASPMSGTTEVVPCYKAHKFNTLRGAFSFRAGATLDAFALKLTPDL
jgi:hypothetical protein